MTDYTDDFFREQYSAELDHTDKLDSADSLLVGVLLALSGVSIYYFRVLPSCGFGIAGCTFLACCSAFLVAFALAISFVVASFWPRMKGFISSPEDWARYVGGLESYYTHYHDAKEAREHVANELAQSLRRQYVEAGEVNRKHNIRKMGYQTRAKRCITAAVAIMLLNGFPAYFVQRPKADTQKTEVVSFPEIQKVEIIAPKGKDQSNERREEASTTASTAPEAPAGTSEAGTTPSSVGQERANARGKAPEVTGKD